MSEPKKRLWFVWHTEYKDEGAELYEAPNAWAAKRLMRESWGSEPGDEEWSTPLTAMLATPEEASRWLRENE